MVDEEEAETEAEPTPKFNKKLILFALVGFLMVGGGAASGAYYFATKNAPRAQAPGEEGETEVAEVAELPTEAHYVALDPAFTVNFEREGRAQFLQVSLQAMTRDPEVVELIERNMPMIRNNLVLIFSARSSDDLDTMEGKEALREATRAGIQEVVVKEGGEGEVEAVYFTSFVMQ